MDGGKPLRRRQRGCSHRPQNLHLDYRSHTIPVPVPGAGHHPLGKSLPISLVALDPLFPGSGGPVAGPVCGGIPRAPGVGPEPIPLNLYQGGMCNSVVLKTAEGTPHHLISPMGPNWVATENAAWRYVHFTLALVLFEFPDLAGDRRRSLTGGKGSPAVQTGR